MLSSSVNEKESQKSEIRTISCQLKFIFTNKHFTTDLKFVKKRFKRPQRFDLLGRLYGSYYLRLGTLTSQEVYAN